MRHPRRYVVCFTNESMSLGCATVLRMGIRRIVADIGWKLCRYRLIGRPVPREPGIIIGAPHTSLMDFVAFLGVMWHSEIRMRILMKHTMFTFAPLAAVLRTLGAISVDRANPAGVVDELVRQIRSGETFQLVLAPKGTRAQRDYWKSGFYRIAVESGLPVTLASIDSRRREVEVGPTLRLTGDVVADMTAIRDFYADKAGLRPQLRSEPRLRAEDELGLGSETGSGLG